jgi:ADP-ribose pyrophosphatase YjhB (NUDIX family)
MIKGFENRITAAGGIFYSQDTKRLLVALRAGRAKGWAGWGGKIEPNETPEDALRREVWEETHYKGPMRLTKVYRYESPSLVYYNYLIEVPKQFTPMLDSENITYLWVDSLDDIPKPIHQGFNAALPLYKRLLQNEAARFSLKQAVLETYNIEETKKYVRRKDRFYHPRDKDGTLDPRNGGYEGDDDVLSEEDSSSGRT